MAKPSKLFDIKNTIIHQPSVTLQFNNTIMNNPVTYRVSNKYNQLTDLPGEKVFDFHKIFSKSKLPALSPVDKKSKRKTSKKRKSESIIQTYNQYETEFEGKSVSKILPNSRNVITGTSENNASRFSRTRVSPWCYFHRRTPSKARRSSSRIKKDSRLFKKKLIISSTYRAYNGDQLKELKSQFETMDSRQKKKDKSVPRSKDYKLSSEK